jgi:hypothetical protein
MFLALYQTKKVFRSQNTVLYALLTLLTKFPVPQVRFRIS